MIRVLLTSSVLILVILLLRALFRGKVGNGLIYALWLVVAVRLLMPVPEFFLEKVAGIEKPWVGSSVSVMNLAAQLASHWDYDITGQREEEADKSSGENLGKSAGEEPEISLSANSEKEEAAASKGAEEENATGEKRDETGSQKPGKTEKGDVEVCKEKSGGGVAAYQIFPNPSDLHSRNCLAIGQFGIPVCTGDI